MMFKPSYIVYFTFFLLITNLVPMTQSYTIPPTKTILVMGACCMDRSIPVSTYPNEDTKIRSDDPIVESGGGNGANTACAIANLISSSNYEDGVQIQVRLLSKVGDDAVGKSLLSELKEAGVDTTFVRVQSRTTSSLTHIIVANNAITGQSSRTCIHTPGSCGELTSIDIDEMHFDAIFSGNVVHFHSDSRHTSAAKILAEEAKRRGISVSVDAEKDRGPGDFDTLLELADILFTNQDMCKDYLRRSTTSTRSDSDLRLSLKSEDNDVDQIRAKNLLRHFISKYDQSRKIVVATRGSKGCYSVNTCENKLISLTEVGIVPCSDLIDTTGAGDAFIGGYLAFTFAISVMNDPLHKNTNCDNIDRLACLRFASWVASQSLRGIGRSKLPSSRDVSVSLGDDSGSISTTLNTLFDDR